MIGVKRLVLFCVLTLELAMSYLLLNFQMENISSPLFIQEWIKDHHYDSSFFFSIILLVILVMIFVNRKKTFGVAIGGILGLSSYICWFSASNWWAVYSVSPYEQRFLAVILLCIALWVSVSKSSLKKRRHFSAAVRKEAIQKQKGRCAACKRKLVSHGLDLDHRKGDRSNNKLSNCQVLCVPCHRQKHSS
jgi:hypothetical protein